MLGQLCLRPVELETDNVRMNLAANEFRLALESPQIITVAKNLTQEFRSELLNLKFHQKHIARTSVYEVESPRR